MSSPESPPPPPQPLSYAETVELRDRHIGKSCTLYYSHRPLKIVRAERQYMYDETGRRYLDCANNVAHVGHCHPRVVAAECDQAARLNTNARFLHDNLVAYARRLCALFPPPLTVCYLVNSGSEANDLALQLARWHTGGEDVVCVDHAYHGHLASVLPVSPYKYRQRPAYSPPDWVHVAPTPDTYRGIHRRRGRDDHRDGDDDDDDDDFGALYALEVRRIVERTRADGRRLAAFVAESLLSCAGQIRPPAGYLRRVYECVREAGGVCVADEVQVGFGRVGAAWWAFQLQGADVVPDIVTLGKPMGNGYPVSAVVTTPQIADSFYRAGGSYFSTFGGNPVACAVANAVLDVVEQERLMENARDVGAYLLALLTDELWPKHAVVGDVRGVGLFVGVELVKDRATKEPATAAARTVCDRLKDECLVVISVDGPHENVLKLKPPMVFTKENARYFVDCLDKILSTL